MPNWCENDLWIIGDEKDIQDCLEKIGGDKGAIDFEKIIPYPAIFEEIDKCANKRPHDTHPGMFQSDPYELTEEQKKKILEVCGEGTKTEYDHNSFNSWGYNWNIRNWGTKWNATMINAEGDIEEHGTIWFHLGLGNDDEELIACKKLINFCTAWSPPTPIVEALGKLFPKLTFWMKYWECGMGFKGEYAVKGETQITDYSTEYKGSMDPEGCRGG